MSGGGTGRVVLPDGVRRHVVELAAQRLATLDPDQVPRSLRAVARFVPARRARLGATPIAAALEADEAFRAAVADGVRESFPDLVESLAAGQVPAAGRPEEVAAVAYLLRSPGWEGVVEDARTAEERRAGLDRTAKQERTVRALREQVEAERATARADADRAREEAAAVREELAGVRRELRAVRERMHTAERERAEARQALEEERREAAGTASVADAEVRRLRSRLAEAQAAAEAVRRSAREGRHADEARLWLLLEVLAGAVRGLRQELALSPPTSRPADAVSGADREADGAAGDPFAGVRLRGLSAGDPAVLDQLLALPQVHLVVDGYNVTKTAFGELPLEAQRSRLVAGLAGLAARTGAEVTCVFDGATRPPAAPPVPRQVRVVFSAEGEIADDVIRRLVRAEPAGRPVVVVSSDREVADDVRAAGAWPVPSAVFARLVERG